MLKYAFKRKKSNLLSTCRNLFKKNVPLRKIVQKHFMLKGAFPLEKSF